MVTRPTRMKGHIAWTLFALAAFCCIVTLEASKSMMPDEELFSMLKHAGRGMGGMDEGQKPPMPNPNDQYVPKDAYSCFYICEDGLKPVPNNEYVPELKGCTAGGKLFLSVFTDLFLPIYSCVLATFVSLSTEIQGCL